jgi:hypothetical protein
MIEGIARFSSSDSKKKQLFSGSEACEVVVVDHPQFQSNPPLYTEQVVIELGRVFQLILDWGEK